MSDAPVASNTGGVVVTYHPDAGLRERVRTLAQQVDRVLVVDNGSSERRATIVHDLEAVSGVDLLLNDQNRGVATAFNQGILWARERGYHWALLSDQDTQFEEGALSTLGSVWQAHPSPQRIAVIGCNFVDRNLRVLQYGFPSDHGPPWSEQATVISAGSLLSLDAFEQLGPLADEFFIDHVDHEYCLRARSKGFRVLATKLPLMQHAVGVGSIHGKLGLITYNHSPERWYYMLRNEVSLVRRYLWREPRWALVTVTCRLRSLLLMLLLESHRIAKLRNAAIGFLDGAQGRFTHVRA
jgi:rhamnosyltransferase